MTAKWLEKYLIAPIAKRIAAIVAAYIKPLRKELVAVKQALEELKASIDGRD
jgi:hypothetical protein